MIYEVPQLHPLGLVKPEGLLSSPKQSEISPVLLGTQAAVHTEVRLTLTDAQTHESQDCLLIYHKMLCCGLLSHSESSLTFCDL